MIRGRHNGWTFVELLVVTGIVALLLAIVLPTIRTVNIQFKDVVNLASLRSTAQSFQSWGNEHDDRFPNVGRPAREGDSTLLDLGPGNGFVITSYGSQVHYWTIPLAAWLKEGSPTWHSVYKAPPEEAPPSWSVYPNANCITSTSFLYSTAMLYDPRWFTVDARAHFRNSWTAARFVRWSEVAFPSDKGLLYDSARPSVFVFRPSMALVFVDGSAAVVGMSDAVASGESEYTQIAVERTWQGVLGRDFTR